MGRNSSQKTHFKKFKMTGVFVPKSIIHNEEIKNFGTEIGILLELNRHLKANNILPTTQYLCWFFKKTPATITSLINKLNKKGFIKKLKIPDKKIYYILKSGNKKPLYGCEFCNVFDIPLDSHHYPIRKKDGGKQTISLCPNCHRKFHLMAEQTYRITSKFKKIFHIGNN